MVENAREKLDAERARSIKMLSSLTEKHDQEVRDLTRKIDSLEDSVAVKELMIRELGSVIDREHQRIRTESAILKRREADEINLPPAQDDE